MGNVSFSSNENKRFYIRQNSKSFTNDTSNGAYNHTQTGGHSIGVNSKKTTRTKNMKSESEKEIINRNRNNTKLSFIPSIFQEIFPPPTKSHLRNSYKDKSSLRLSKDGKFYSQTKNFNFVDVVNESLL